jgi:hypothetical protein
MTHGRLHLDQVTSWSGPPLLRAVAVSTGTRTHRSITVAPLHLVVMTVTDAYEPNALTAFRGSEEALAAAERIMAAPDSRGIIRDWRLGHEPSGETLYGPGDGLGRRGEPGRPQGGR